MKVFLKKDIEKVGMSGEIIKVNEGYARNFLFPRGLAVEINEENEQFYLQRERKLENRKQAIATETSLLAERIGSIKLAIKQKMHDDGKLFGALSQKSIAEALAKEGVSVSKNQVIFDKPIKSKGTFEVTIKLSARLMPKIKVVVLPE